MIIRRLIVGTMPFVLGGLLGCGDTGAKQLPESGFQVAFESHNVASDMKSGKTVSADITVKNVSPVTWPSKPDNQDRYAVHLSYHWLNRKGATVVFDGLRTPLPRDLKPGESVNLKATIQAPAEPGRHTLEVTLVQEHSAWFPEIIRFGAPSHDLQDCTHISPSCSKTEGDRSGVIVASQWPLRISFDGP